MALERSEILAALGATDYDGKKAAKLLGASVRTLQYRMRELHIPPMKRGPRKKRLQRGGGGKHRGAVYGALALGTAIAIGVGIKYGGGKPTSSGKAVRFQKSVDFPNEPFTKDKFEYAMVWVANACGHRAVKARTGNRGHDITIDGIDLVDDHFLADFGDTLRLHHCFSHLPDDALDPCYERVRETRKRGGQLTDAQLAVIHGANGR